METELEGFDEFWRIFPRRVAKQAAIRMYKRALKLTTPAEILRAAKQYAQERAGQDANYTKHPATWLNAGCWGDYVPYPFDRNGNGVADVGFYADFSSAELEAWQTYGRQTRGRTYPTDKRGGWRFPTRWPPCTDR